MDVQSDIRRTAQALTTPLKLTKPQYEKLAQEN